MKTTIDLPARLVRDLKTRAARQGVKMKDLAAELLREGLTAKRPLGPVVIEKDPKTGLPILHCYRTPEPHEQLTPDRIAQVLLDQEVEWALGAG